VPDDQVAEAIRNGICKVNYATELRQAFTRGFMGYMAENPNNFDPKKPSKPGMEEIYGRVLPHGQPRLHQQGIGARTE
jgi:fructose-bisphosphate aldolase class II/tagatose 1,6-diphosphate aldolase GatY/KbaY